MAAVDDAVAAGSDDASAAAEAATAAAAAAAVGGAWAAADARVRYEYLDHTADVQIHSWGATLEEAFAQQVVAPPCGYAPPCRWLSPLPSLSRSSR